MKKTHGRQTPDRVYLSKDFLSKRCRTGQCDVYFYRLKFENGNPG
jgi:hypothetical protein